MKLTDRELSDIRSRHDMASPGGWECLTDDQKYPEYKYTIYEGGEDDPPLCVIPPWSFNSYHNSMFLTHAVEDVGKLLKEVERLRETLEEEYEYMRMAGL